MRSTDEPERIRAIGDKTPEHAGYLPLLSHLYPEAKVIHVIRDGRDAAVSGWAHLKRDAEEGQFAGFHEYAAYFAQKHWVWSVEAALEGFMRHGSELLKQLGYETTEVVAQVIS